MSLIHCPECATEVSAAAVACPNCGRPIQPPAVVARKVIVTQPVDGDGGFPTWAFIPIGVAAIALLFVIYLVVRQGDDQGNLNINVNTASRRATTVPPTDSRTVSVPPSSETAPVSAPPSQTTTVPSTTTSAPAAPPPDKGTVVINARVAPRSGSPTAARSTKFYLLDKNLESILSEARVEPIEGNSLTASLGLAAVFPDRYGDFQRAAMRAIAGHVKYSGTTNGSGSTSLAGVAPNEYYLFGITRIGRGFALWDSSVSIIAGENVMNLSPQSVTEIPES